MDYYYHSDNDLFAQAVADTFVTPSFGIKEEYPTSSLPSDDIWKKFELVTPPSTPIRELDNIFEFVDTIGPSSYFSDDIFGSDFLSTETLPGIQQRSFSREARELRHDCMWAGECSSAEHVKSRPRSTSRPTVQARVETPITDESDGDSDTSGFSSDGTQKVCIIKGTRPDSLLKPVIAIMGRKGGGAPTTTSDHSYFTPNREDTSIDVESFGMQTPSDSEEEIDVVGDRSGVAPGTTVRKVSGPGQSLRLKLRVPATQDPEELQRRITAAIQAAQRNSAQILAGKKFCYHIAKGRPPKKPADSASPSATPKRKADSTDGGSPSKKANRGSDSEDPEKRSMHNCMERKRRVDLRNAFDTLRSFIPDLRDMDRVSKVTILKKATLYCQALSAVDKRLQREKAALALETDALRNRLEALQRL